MSIRGPWKKKEKRKRVGRKERAADDPIYSQTAAAAAAAVVKVAPIFHTQDKHLSQSPGPGTPPVNHGQ